jgi:hypothetical protein
MDAGDRGEQSERAGAVLPSGRSDGALSGGRQKGGRALSFFAALPDLVLAALFGLDQFAGVTMRFMPDRWLRSIVALQFIVIHSFPFLMAIAMVRHPATGCRWCRGILFWGLSAFYLAGSFQLGGFPGLLSFVGLTFTTYVGFLLRRTQPGAGFDLTLRWMVGMALFMTAAIVFDMPPDVESWPSFPQALWFGFTYFLALGFIEAAGLYRCRLVLRVREFFGELLREWRERMAKRPPLSP